MRKIFILLIAIAIIVPLAYEVSLWVLPYNSNEVIIDIPEGTPASIIAKILVDSGAIRSKFRFIGYVRLTGKEKELSYGEYLIPPNSNFIEVLNRLLDAKVMYHRVTILEGWTIRETARQIEKEGFGSFDTFLALCKDPVYAQELTGFPVNSLEGFLYPDTYHFPRNVSEDFIIRHLVSSFFRRIAKLEIPETIPYSFYEIITLASIVEKEATFNDEKPLIAGVFLNRLQIGKKLQADPTVAYLLAKDGIRRKIILYRDLEIDSPYNTYRYTGLPPTPICSPAVSTIQAVLQPENTDYFYFFANRQGRHIFSRTYTEHLNKQRALRNSDDNA